MTTFAFRGVEGVPAALDFGPVAAELKRRGFPSIIVRTARSESKTPNQDSADAMIEALRDVRDDVVIVGVSHQGLYLPLIAAARPVRRLVYVNALIARPGRPFIEILKEEPVFAPGLLEATIKSVEGMTSEFLDIVLDPSLPAWLRRVIHWRARTSGARSRINGLLEPCPLKELPKVESVFICAAQDQAVRSEWQQQAARELLGVEAIVISGARHGSILRTHRREVAEAATQGLRPNGATCPDHLVTKSLIRTTGTYELQSDTVLLDKLLRNGIHLKGIIYSAMPVLLFVGVYLSGSKLTTAVVSSLGASIVILLLHLFRHEPLWPAIAGLFGVAIEASVAYLTGSARGFFLIRIWGSFFAATVLLLSVLVRWPVVGVVWSTFKANGQQWRSDRLAYFYYCIATLLWALVFGARFVVENWLYNANAVGWLGFARVVMGLPLTAFAVLITAWAIRKAAREKRLAEPRS